MKIDLNNIYFSADTNLPELCLDKEEKKTIIRFAEDSVIRKTTVAVWSFDKKDNEVVLGRIRLDVCILPNFNYMCDDDIFWLLDGENAELGESAEIILRYRKKVDKYREDRLSGNNKIAIVQMHEFYIDPQYRGLGISKKVLLTIPKMIETYFGIGRGYIAAYINPYKKQLSISDMDVANQIYCNEEMDPELYNIMRKTIENAGFKAVSRKKKEKHFVASFWNMDNIALKEGILEKLNYE